eukprot:5844085-Amphidinium_carterae.1
MQLLAPLPSDRARLTILIRLLQGTCQLHLAHDMGYCIHPCKSHTLSTALNVETPNGHVRRLALRSPHVRSCSGPMGS